MTFVGASAMINGKTQGAFPAAKALLSAVYEGALVPFDLALKVEARWFTNVIMNPSSSAMIRSLFINKSALEKGAVRPKDISDQSVKKLGVLGAGMMGAGIALVSAQAGIEVVLIDQTQEAADRGKNFAEKHLDKGIKFEHVILFLDISDYYDEAYYKLDEEPKEFIYRNKYVYAKTWCANARSFSKCA